MAKKIDKPLSVGKSVRGRWPVVSGEGAEAKTYLVDPNTLRCDCPSGQWQQRGRPVLCRHLRAVLDHLTGKTA